MTPVFDSWTEPLVRGELSLDALAELGDPDPPKSRQALEEAARVPDLADHAPQWVPYLLATARPGFGASALADIAQRFRQIRRAPIPPACLPAAAVIAGSSNFLTRLLRRHAHWVTDLEGLPPEAPAPTPVEPDWTSIRIAKYRGLLRIAARDLLGRPFDQSLAELSQLADRCLEAALQRAALETDCAPPAILALGKLGGLELNFSSDVDLLAVYRAQSPEEDLARNAEVAKLLQHFKRHLEVSSEDGFGYRVDLDLRPEGRSGTLANSVDAALHYYESFGVEWERQALLRLRHVAGPAETAQTFARGIEPFVYRRTIDPATIANVRQMKERIEQERRHDSRELARNLKEGPGGIRDVEFFVQALQLLYAGRTPELRTGNVLCALDRLAAHGLFPDGIAKDLRSNYLWLRRAEHACQLPEERQTYHLPDDPAGETALARRMGYADPSARRARDRLLGDWTRVRTEVRAQFEALVLEGANG